MRKYYISGPMRGIYEFNFPAFHCAAAKIRSRGHYAFDPAEHDEQRGFDSTGMSGKLEEAIDAGFSLREALAFDCQWICNEATHIWMLPGWSESRGATAERALGLALGLTIEGAAA